MKGHCTGMLVSGVMCDAPPGFSHPSTEVWLVSVLFRMQFGLSKAVFTLVFKAGLDCDT